MMIQMLKMGNTYSWWECKPIQSTIEISEEVDQKEGKKIPYHLSMLFYYIHPKDSVTYSTHTCSSIFIYALLLISRKKARCSSSDEWMRKACHTFTIDYQSAIRKKEKMELHRQINIYIKCELHIEQETITLSKVTQTQTDRATSITSSLNNKTLQIYMVNLKYC